MGRAGRLRKPDVSGSHAKLNAALHALHKGAGLPPLASMVRALEGAGISRSTVYDAFSSTRLPSWEVIDALVEVLAAKHPRTSPEEVQPRFYDAWLLAVDEEPNGATTPVSEYPQLPAAILPGPPEHLLTGHRSGAAPGGSPEPSAAGEVRQQLDRRRRDAAASLKLILDVDHSDRLYLDVPYNNRDKVKNVGALWDSELMKWYIPNPRGRRAASAEDS